MISKNQIKYIRSLQQKKYRRLHQEFIAEGPKIVFELIQSDYRIKSIYGTEQFKEEYNNLFEKKSVHIETISEKELKQISTLSTPNQVLSVSEIPDLQFDPSNIDELVLALENLQDPGNLGAIIRSADWFGINTIICSEDTVDLYNPKVIQATMGSFLRIKVHYVNLEEVLEKLPEEIPVFGTVLNGENIYQAKLDDTGIILIGNESKGISNHLMKSIDKKISIPRQSDSWTESLNASIAASLVMAEFRRRFQV